MSLSVDQDQGVALYNSYSDLCDNALGRKVALKDLDGREAYRAIISWSGTELTLPLCRGENLVGVVNDALKWNDVGELRGFDIVCNNGLGVRS
jgi:hypothetical protein